MIHRVAIKNYKSIGSALVELGPLTVLVGPNGAGKSNFVDALSFVADSLNDNIEVAFNRRGGIADVRRRSGGHPTNIGMRLSIQVAADAWADYSFEISAKLPERFEVSRERCHVASMMGREYSFEVRQGHFTQSIPGIRPQIPADRLALRAASDVPEFRPVYDFLTRMRFYSLDPSRLRERQIPSSKDYLERHGENAARILKLIRDGDGAGGDSYARICRLLSRAVPGVRKVDYDFVGGEETLQFKQEAWGQKHPWRFEARNMSDGTLRILGLLLAIYQPSRPSLIAIEEPEATVHPAVAELVVDVLFDGTREGQVLVTTHSPDVLDHKDLRDSQIRVVESHRGRTAISPLAESSREVIRKRLYTPGELLRVDELIPDRQAAEKAASQLNLFGRVERP